MGEICLFLFLNCFFKILFSCYGSVATCCTRMSFLSWATCLLQDVSFPFGQDLISNSFYPLVLAFCKHLTLLPSQNPAGIPRLLVTCQNMLAEARKEWKKEKRMKKRRKEWEIQRKTRKRSSIHCIHNIFHIICMSLENISLHGWPTFPTNISSNP